MKRLKSIFIAMLLVVVANLSFASVRTVVFMYKETSPGQDIFIKGGHDAGLVPSVYPSMSEPITYLNTLNTTTAAIKADDASLDWGTESALDWTCDSWPSDWGTKRTYAADGYGEDPENTMGIHWWKFNVMMDGVAGEWYEFKAFMREGSTEWWESDRGQASTPHSTINHWGKKGYITKCRYNENWVEFIQLGGGGNQDPTADFTVSPSAGNISTTYNVDASASADPEDGANVQIRWDWNNDGTYDTSWSYTKTASTTYSTPGTRTIKLEVKDSQGATDTKTLTVDVNNTAPTADFTRSPTSGYKDTTTFNVDAAGSTDLEDGVSGLQVRWDWNNDGTYDTSWSYTKTAGTTYSSTGTKTIKLEVKDSAGLTDTKTLNVTVNAGGGEGDHPGYYTGQLGANLYANGTEFSIWARLGSTVKTMTINGGTTNYHNMTKISGGNNDCVWWVFVPGVQKNTTYKYVINETTTVCDPYAKYSRYSCGPNVVVDDTFVWTDSSWQRPSWDYYIIYELHIKDFTSADPSVSAVNRGKYRGVIEKLPYLQNLGVTAIELMPISEFPDAGYGWGYNTSLFMSPESGYAVDPYNAQDGVDQLKELIDAAHNAGIAVIFDMVFNHTANNDNWLWQIDEVAYFDFSGDGVVEAGPGQADSTPWGNKLNTHHPIVHRLAKDVCEYYMTEFHVDGFRYDATHTDFMDHDFIRGLKGHLSSIAPNVFFSMENLPNQSDLKTWGSQWAAEYRHRGKDLLCGWGSINMSYFAQHIYYTKDHGWSGCPVETMNYLESHDEDTLKYLFDIAGMSDEAAKWKTRLGAVMLGSSLGMPMIWMGQEFLRAREGQSIDELPLDWSLYTTYNDVHNYYAGVFRLRRDNPAMRLADESGFSWQYAPWGVGNDNNVAGYSLQSGNPSDKKFVVVLNNNSSSRTVTVGFPESGTWTKVITETSTGGTGTIYVSGSSHTITVQGSSGVIYQK